MVHIFLLAGQSNMQGAAPAAGLPAKLKTAPASVRLFELGEFRPLVWRDSFGPEAGLAERAADFCDGDMVFCKHALGGTNLYYDWNPDGVSRGDEDAYRGPLYPQLMENFSLVKQHLETEKKTWKVRGLFWMQGERDSVIEKLANAYDESLRGLIAAVRKDTGEPDLPVVLGLPAPKKYNMDEDRFQHRYRHIVWDKIDAVADADPLVRVAETLDLPQQDNLHFDAAGQLLLGRRMAQLMGELVHA